MDLISGVPFWPLRNGNGITFSLIAAEIVRDLVCEGHSRDAELFRFDRTVGR